MTNWSEPLISPPDDALQHFFTLFERGFSAPRGSLQLEGTCRHASPGWIDSSGGHSARVAVRPPRKPLRQNVDVYID